MLHTVRMVRGNLRKMNGTSLPIHSPDVTEEHLFDETLESTRDCLWCISIIIQAVYLEVQ
jgi:hypothetical protein